MPLCRPLALFAVTMLSACAAPMAAPSMSPAKVEQTSLGPVWADEAGMTLYTFSKDAPDKSNCNGPCAANWPPFVAAPGAQGEGAWSVITRADGKMQWAYKGHPLYTWKKDQKPGDTTGNGFLHGAWHVAQP